MRSLTRFGLMLVSASVLASSLTACGDSSDDAGGAAATAQASSAPSISGTPATSVQAGRTYKFVPTAQGGRGGTLQFTIANQPAWASFDPATGQLSGTPAARDARVYSNISIQISSGGMSASLRPFSIQVLAPSSSGAASAGDALELGGTPASTASVGTAYRFQPTLGGGSGGTVTYSVENLPSWATFDATTGTLGGTPTASEAGNYASIVITATEGGQVASIGPFSIDVSSGSSAVATVSWTPPTGASASDVAGYRVYYGTTAAGLTKYVTVQDPNASSYVISNLSPGTWYFAIASFDATQSQSARSQPIQVTI